jgi:hypothetical protein
MAHQAKMTHGGNGSPVTEVLTGIGDFGNDVVTLATLQSRLAVADARESLSRAVPAAIAGVILVPLAFAAFTAGLVGLGFWLSAASGIAQGPALLIVAVIALVVAAVLGALAVSRLRGSFESFRRSREELERNIAWLGTILKQGR